ncbi:hypothetical protein M9H77_17612 [Catharanthus roseus]|uniref:Uncharacterized protein n=1 Tax=Catharanthus roseus TaxID=4058 RepID=A0ACC0B534_CATRO|nr:hypothetical protein M9H77_17612 [Catharanthus roseus]
MSHPRDGEAWNRLVHHNIDMMYNEQNVFGNVFNTIMDVKGNCLAELSLFFRELYAPKISESYMREFEESIRILICKLERIFHLGFFDIMQYLMIYLSYEARLCGYVLQVDAYLIEEVAIFFSYYFEESVPTLQKQVRRNDDVRNPLHKGEVLSICNQQGRKFAK